MNLNRREVLKFGGVGVLTLSLPAAIGCGVDVVALANDFIAAAKAIVNADPTGPWVPALNEAIQAMETAVAGWNGSTVNCALQSAANAAAAIINEIDPGSTVALIATIAIAGFDVLMANLAPCTTPASLKLKFHSSTVLRGTATYTTAEKAIEGAIFKSRAFKNQFNDAAKLTGLTVRI